ncbi:hypothetical protein B5X24_HaOG217131 [Helicoverpa armigera]|uniref:Uncharacterized protein n=1 Tax=Helicoverpa armigera TaxID=29058 RepID=A0A2W1BYS9_HELAM|nr:hypothetical protein B5X24_HaOG217131 [Helicoverpa armigera]
MKSLMKGELPLSLRKLVDMCILPILTYGAQTWSLTETQKSRLKVCQSSMERSLLNIRLSNRIRNTIIQSQTGIVDVGNKSAKLKIGRATSVECTRTSGPTSPQSGSLRMEGEKRETKVTLERRLRQLPLGLATNSDG